MHLFFEKVYHLLSIAVFMALKNQKFWFTLLLIFITTNLCFGCFFLTAAGFLFTFLWILTLAIIMSIAWPFSKTRLNIIQLMTGFEYNSSFVWPSNGSVDRRRSLRATDPFEGQTKLLLFEKPVYSCFVIHLHFFKIFLFTLSTDISMKCFQNPRPSSPRIWTTPWHCYVNITWLIEPMKIRPSVNSSIAGNRSINCWPVNRTVSQLIGILLLTVIILCVYCIAFI